MTSRTLTSRSYGRFILKKNLFGWIERSWTQMLGYSHGFHTLIKGWLVFNCQFKVDTILVLLSKWCCGITLMILKNWMSKLDRRMERVTKHYIWVKMPILALELWFVKAFKTISDMVEQFKTSHMCIVAKILVELDVKEGSMKEIEIMVGNCIYIRALEDKKEDKEAMQIELDAG